jgi:hypothetical protein
MGRVHAAAACLHVAIVLAGCGSKNDDDGELGGHCYPNATCNVGLSCSAGICLVADAAVDAPPDVRPDAALDAYVCTDAYEPNNTVPTAYATSVDGTNLSQALPGTLCPGGGGDKDYFAVSISVANRNLELLVDLPASDPQVFASILNSGGVPIANAVAVTGMPARLRAYTPNLPTGTYYVETYTSTTSTAHPYTATVNVTGP